MSNIYKQRNFSKRNVIAPSLVDTETAVILSNSLYDKNKGLTHYFLHTHKGKEDDEVRLIGDVEIAMSQSEAVTSEFSPEYRQKLAMGLASAKGSGPTGLTDEQLMESVPCNIQLERDEIANFAKSEIDSLDSLASRVKATKTIPPSPTETTQPTDTPPTENPN